MEQRQINTKTAGIDVCKPWLDVAVYGLEDALRVANDKVGYSELIGWLRAREVGRVGLEATGGYERGVREALEAASFEVVLHQPREVKAFATLKRWRAKNDKLDARLIAAATTQIDGFRAAQDLRLVELAERLTAYEQVSDQAAYLKTCLEQTRLKDVINAFRAQIAALERLKAKLLGKIVLLIKQHADLLARFRLLVSLPGVGPVVAASLVVRMPELGAMQRGQAAALLGVAPFDRDSGLTRGIRFICGGRSRPRRMVYLAAVQAKRCDPTFRAFAERLAANNKPAKLINVAVMRKLIEAANSVLSRGQPWVRATPA